MNRLAIGILSLTVLGAPLLAQIPVGRLDTSVSVSQRTMLEIYLDLTAAKLSNGSLWFGDLGRLNHICLLSLTPQGRVKCLLTRNASLQGIEEKACVAQDFQIVLAAVWRLMRERFRSIKWDESKDFVGEYYRTIGPTPDAKWEKGKLDWGDKIKEEQ